MTTRTCIVDKNKNHCTCSFSCPRAGLCCECIEYHKAKAEIPGCYFPKAEEKTGNRSVENFAKIVQKKGTDFLR